ncbi:hypothetical protein GobsT_71350 [Gemmata obscuriglobus]|uniref:Phage tail protein n=1 Tax=Gemmata obscuriglobus TaxID=114 RepID=A0A2Z3HBJ7_9BACT|nr:hypothetical protein [Gemmata obscuriglobus]AWM41762.1 hypothetical protein C1280_35380 [Gemmata obscuriglobus]QEG32282.1 hypothetical protein GobsT_71350 [Gemmata obscuriglobus]VTS11638.1 unnamed protein product [Gemmata obscuriglobus UQM 2246]
MALSVSEAVGDAAKAAVEALGLTRPAAGEPLTTAVPVTKRKTPSVPDGDRKGLPQVVVSVGEFGAVEKIDAETDLVKYPCAVTIVTAGGEKAGDDPAVRDWLDRVRKKLQAVGSWAGVTDFNTVTTVGKAPFDPGALSKAFNFSTQVFTVEVLETRT